MDVSAHSLPDQLSFLAGSISHILPELFLVGAFLLMIVLEISVGRKNKMVLPYAALLSGLVYLAAVLFTWPEAVDTPLTGTFLGMIRPDAFAAWFKLLFALGGIMTVIVSLRSRTLAAAAKGLGEYYIIVIAMLIGAAFMGMATNLLMMYLALELVSLPSYMLTAYARLRHKSAEASLKYVIYGGFASAVMLYGISWLYGMTGTLDPTSASFLAGLEAAGAGPATFVLALVLGGFLFKIGALPFHFWAPDVYEGAPHPVVSFFSIVPKVAGFAMLIRFVYLLAPTDLDLVTGQLAGADAHQNLRWILLVFAIASMFLGNLVALRQTHIRRMLAYSSIAHAGYMLVGLVCVGPEGLAAVLFYLSVYVVMNFGAFALAGWMEEELGITEIDQLKGIATGLPILAVVASVLMVSLTGLPPTAGFIAKLEIVLAALGDYQQSGDFIMLFALISLLLNTVISLFYYLRIPGRMIFSNPVIKSYPQFRGWVPWLLLAICIPVLWLGIISFDELINFFRTLTPS